MKLSSDFDESPTQLIGETRTKVPAAPGILARTDTEYRRNGTANLSAFVDVHRPWRHIKVTDRRTNVDFAHGMKDLCDVHFPTAKKLRVVLDNLSTHTVGALYDSFPAPEACRLSQRLEFHYTPKHAIWLNMVEIELGVLRKQCLDRRIADRPTLEREIAAWEEQRNDSGVRITWLFDLERARSKLIRSYPVPADSAPAKTPLREAA